MPLEQLIHKIKTNPEHVEFTEVIDGISAHYHYQPVRFSNGQAGDSVINEAGTNEGSCKIFAFAQLNQLDEQQTLHCFGQYYRQDVLQNPDGDDHANIRTFMRHGWAGIQFDAPALTLK